MNVDASVMAVSIALLVFFRVFCRQVDETMLNLFAADVFPHSKRVSPFRAPIRLHTSIPSNLSPATGFQL